MPVAQDLPAGVASLGSDITPEQLYTYEKLSEIEGKRRKEEAILRSWEGQQNEERKLRGTYARFLLFGLLTQALVVNFAFFAIGYKLIQIDQWVANTFIVAVFGEIAAMTLIVTKYLFPDNRSEMKSLLDKL